MKLSRSLKMIVKNNLLNFKNKYIYQDTDYFKMSIDSVLLANFVNINLRDKRIMDIATGNAPIPMLLSFRTKATIYGVELQKEVYDLGISSLKVNGLDKQIRLINDDAKNLVNIFDSDYFDVVTCNPPYFNTNNVIFENDNDIKALARHEKTLNLDDIFSICKKILKNNGRLAMVHRNERLMEIMIKMKEYNIEPKRIRFVYPKMNKNCSIILIEGVKNGKPGLTVLPPLFVYDNSGKYSKEIMDMYGE